MTTLDDAIDYFTNKNDVEVDGVDGVVFDEDVNIPILGDTTFIVFDIDYLKEVRLRVLTRNVQGQISLNYYHKISYIDDNIGALNSLYKKINDICKGSFTYCKMRNWLYMDGDNMDDDVVRNEFVYKKILFNQVQDCCVCLEPTTRLLDCCKGSICRLCYVKTIDKEDDMIIFKCPLCRNITKQ